MKYMKALLRPCSNLSNGLLLQANQSGVSFLEPTHMSSPLSATTHMCCCCPKRVNNRPVIADRVYSLLGMVYAKKSWRGEQQAGQTRSFVDDGLKTRQCIKTHPFEEI